MFCEIIGLPKREFRLAWLLLLISTVRLALTSMDTHFGEAEAQRRAEERVQWQKAKRAKNREQAKSRLFCSLKRGFSLLALMTFVAVAFTHQEEIQKFIARHPLGTKAHLVMMLFLLTGQRISDVAKLGKQHIRKPENVAEALRKT